ncbi:MAG: serine/threonine-protein kinase [Gemmatimonadota bacterium]|jgi:serine/threonine-protein kinase
MGTDSGRWRRVQQIFHDALQRPPSARPAFLDEQCGGDRDLQEQVEALLEEDARGGATVLDRGLERVAGELLGAEDPPPERIGSYRVLRVLGRGGMGVVYLAERPDLGQRVAIKVLRDAWLSPGRRQRFADEQRVLAALSHASIARLYDAASLPDGTPYMVMEHVEGSPLTAWCEERRLPLRQRLELFRTVCEAVEAAHRLAVVHRDLKPSNILVTDGGEPKLLDFGIARRLEGVEGVADPTVTGLRLMTPAYAAPERIRGESAGVSVDVYSLGVILYELLTDRLPYDLSSLTPGQVEEVVTTGAAEPPSATLRGVSRSQAADLDVLVGTAMHPDPERRYPSVEALVRDVDRYLSGRPLEARADSLGYRLTRYARRNRAPLSAVAVVLLLVVALVGFYTARLAAARDVALAEAARSDRIQRFMLDLFSGGEAGAGPADSLRVLTLLERGVDEARVLDAEGAVQAELLQTLGGLFRELGELERADSLLVASLERRRELHGPDHPDVASSLVSLALLRADQAELDEAESLARDAFAMARRHRPADHPEVLVAMDAVGVVLQQRGEYDEATALLEEEVRLREAKPADALLSAALGELANTRFYAGDLQGSDSLNRAVLALDRGLYGERHPSVGDGLINLGAIRFQRGDYEGAEALYREALGILEPYYGPDHPETASNLTMLGQALVYQGRYDEAVELLERALAVRERVYGPRHPDVATTLSELATVALQRDRLDLAQARFERIADIYRRAYGEDHYFTAIALSNVASVHQRLGDLDRAEALFRDVVARFTSALGGDDLSTGIARIKLGRVLMLRGRPADAEEHLRAGYDIVAAQAEPSVSWIRAARSDLVEVYEALGRPDQADRFRRELEEAGDGPPG